MADLKKAQQGVWFGNVFVAAGTVLPASHAYASHPDFVDYEVADPAVPSKSPSEKPAAVAAPAYPAPPKAGAGSSRDAWVDYAESKGVEVTDDMTRDDIVEAVEKA
jgi:hypothetical protein